MPSDDINNVSNINGIDHPISYNPARLLDALINTLRLKNDAALARALEIPSPLVSKIRHRKVPVSSSVLIRMHDATGLTISELRELMGDRRKKFRIGTIIFTAKT
ncbi:hypothetical protein JQN73_03905 [Glaciimonas sp. PAMC28666]|nr:hypothetical protein [Glaciimonas sp. PAMC28666]QRX84769.1 hypothetical protein JQN73_03905 [Glaciimonas sp. PAMC28666]